MVIGPRLDTPSAVGDEGRPRATSLTIVAVIVVCFALATGFLYGDPTLFGGLALFIGVGSAGMALLVRDRLGSTVVGNLCFLPSSVAVVALFGLTGAGMLLTAGVVIALLGVTTGWTDTFDGETIKTTIARSGLSYFLGLLELVVFALVVAIAWLAWVLVDGIATSTAPGFAIIGLAVVVGVVSLSLYLAISQVPLVQLTGVHRREKAKRFSGRAKRSLGFVMVGCLAFVVLVPLLLLVGPVRQTLAHPPVALLLNGLTSWFVLAPLLGSGTIALLLAIGAATLRKVTTEFDAVTTRSLGGAIAAIGYITMLIPFVVRIDIFSGISVVTVFFSAILLPLAVYLALALGLFAMAIGLLPERAGPPALAASGLICASIGAAQADLHWLLVFGGVVGGLVAWDVGTFGLGVTAELGHLPETRRLELYHGVFAIGVGFGGLVAVSTLEAVRTVVGTGIGTQETMAVAALGVLLLLALLRG